MPDWKQEIRARMLCLRLPAEAKEEVLAELASHFEDSEGIAVEEVGFSALDLPQHKWRRLCRSIERAKAQGDAMKNHTTSFWIPLFVNLLLTSALLNICNWLGWIELRVERLGNPMFFVQPWLLILPVCGSVAALLARRRQASAGVRLLAAVGPALVWLAALFFVGLIFKCLPSVFAGCPLSWLAFTAIGWFALPVLALSLGAAPFLGDWLGEPKCE